MTLLLKDNINHILGTWDVFAFAHWPSPVYNASRNRKHVQIKYNNYSQNIGTFPFQDYPRKICGLCGA